MRARIINYGYRKVFPTCLGNIRLLPRRPYEFTNSRAVNELRNYKDIQVEILEEDKPIDYNQYPIGQLLFLYEEDRANQKTGGKKCHNMNSHMRMSVEHKKKNSFETSIF